MSSGGQQASIVVSQPQDCCEGQLLPLRPSRHHVREEIFPVVSPPGARAVADDQRPAGVPEDQGDDVGKARERTTGARERVYD